MAYERQYETGVNWQNLPSQSTPINASNLNQMDQAIINVDAEVDQAIIAIESDMADMQQDIAGKQDTLTFDSHPTLGSSRPVTSDGIYRAIQQGGGSGGDVTLDSVYLIGSDNMPSSISPNLTIDTVNRVFDKDTKQYIMFRFGTMVTAGGWPSNYDITLNVNSTGDFIVKKNHVKLTTDNWTIKKDVVYMACANSVAGTGSTSYFWDLFEIPYDVIEFMPVATANVAGKVKPDGTTTTVDANGTISAKSGIINKTVTQSGSINYINVTPYIPAENDVLSLVFTEDVSLSSSQSYWLITGNSGQTLFPLVKNGEFVSTPFSAGTCIIAVCDGGGFVIADDGLDMPENPLATSHGGTGNALGYIRTGQKANTTAGTAATAEGADNTIRGNYSHAEGQLNSATGNYSHAGGYYNVAGYQHQTVIGRFNDNQMTTLFEIGNGQSDFYRSNAFEVYSTGDVKISGSLYVGTSIYDHNNEFVVSVSANPSGDATTPLSKIKIDGTIFSVGSGVSDVAWDTTNKKLTKTVGGTTSDIVTGATILNGLTSAQVTTALGYTPPTQDTNTHRPIQVNGSQVLGNNTTALNLKAGSNVTLTSSGGDVTISASGGGSGSGNTKSKTRYSISSSNWSSSTTDGFYTYSLTLSPALDTSYAPNVSIAGSSNTSQPTDTHRKMYGMLERVNLSSSNTLVLYSPIKPSSTFYVFVDGVNSN